jgi:hypothetical protein
VSCGCIEWDVYMCERNENRIESLCLIGKRPKRKLSGGLGKVEARWDVSDLFHAVIRVIRTTPLEHLA